MRRLLLCLLLAAAPAFAQQAAQAPITVGAVMPQSGNLADLAADLRKALLLWQEGGKAGDGLNGGRVELQLLGDRSQSSDAGKLYEQLIPDSKGGPLIWPFGPPASFAS